MNTTKKTNPLLQREKTVLEKLHATWISALVIIIVGMSLFSFAMLYNISASDGGGTSKE